MATSKPKIINKIPKTLSKFICGGKRKRTTKIAWHYTGAHDVKGINTIVNWFEKIRRGHKVNGKYIYASSNYVCDLDGAIYEYVPRNKIAWTTNQANSYSIGIECATTGKDDHYSDKEYVSMVKLGAWLCSIYDLDPRKDFIRHNDVTGKICPRYFVNNPNKWKQFKNDCYNYMTGKLKEADIRNCTRAGAGNSVVSDAKPTITIFKQYIARVTCNKLNCRKWPGTNYGIVQQINKGAVFTVVAEKDGWVKSKSGYWVSKKYIEFVRYK